MHVTCDVNMKTGSCALTPKDNVPNVCIIQVHKSQVVSLQTAYSWANAVVE